MQSNSDMIESMPSNPETWYLIFHDFSTAVNRRFSWGKDFKHVTALRRGMLGWYFFNSLENKFVFEELLCPVTSDMEPHLFKITHACRWLKLLVDPSEIVKPRWLMVPSCNELVRRLIGLDIGFTLNPWHLWHKVKKYDERLNYQVVGERVKIKHTGV